MGGGYSSYETNGENVGETGGESAVDLCLTKQDFEALTPNLLARTVETVEGGGVVAVLLRSMASLRQLYTMTMDVHSRYRTEAHQDVVGRFNERWVWSCMLETCLIFLGS